MRKPVFKFFRLLLFALVLGGCGGGALELISYEIDDAGVTISDCVPIAEGDLEIPAEIGGLPVISIGDAAFAGCTDLTSITIPEGVTSIGGKAFANCWSLTSVTIPDSVQV